MPTTILENIELALIDYIDGIRTSDGYNFNWGQTNEIDFVSINWDQIGAQAVVDWMDEENTDIEEGAHASACANTCTFRITVRCNIDDPEDLSVRQSRTLYLKALYDLKKLFGTYYDLDGKCHYYMYRSSEINEDSRGDYFVPVSMTTLWRCDYEQDRTSPETFAC